MRHPGISFETPDIFWRVREFDAAICFEVVEHLGRSGNPAARSAQDLRRSFW
jgi:hypothetical protein